MSQMLAFHLSAAGPSHCSSLCDADRICAPTGVLDDLARGALPISGRNHISRSASVTNVLSGSSSGSLRLRDPISGSFGGRTR